MNPDSKEAPLWSAYANTSFFAETPKGMICIRVGAIESTLDSLLIEYNAVEWAFVTAHNPGSLKPDAAANASRHRRLQESVTNDEYKFFPGKGVGTDPNWPPEESILIIGITRDEAICLGRSFGQNAIVVGHRGEPAELIDCRLPQSVQHWSLTTLREKLIKIGAKIVRHSRYVTFQMAEVAIPRKLFRTILRRIDRLKMKSPLPVPG